MPVAYNEETGEARMLAPDGQWAPTKIAKNPDTGEILAYDGQGWQSVHKPGLVERTVRQVKNTVTGENRREFDYPEIGGAREIFDAGGRDVGLGVQRALAITPDPAAQADIITKQLREVDPEISRSQDSFGNEIVTFKGQPYYLNRPGLSMEDLNRFGADTVIYAPAAGLGAGGGRLLGAAVTGAGMAGTSLAQDAAAQQMGSEQPADLGRAGTTGVVGGAFRFVAPEIARAVNRVAGWLTGRLGGANQIVDDAGNLTAKARDTLKAAGIDPDALGPDFNQAFTARVREMADPTMAARVAEAESLPVPVRMTQGQASGKPAEQMFEDLAEKGVYGEQASAMMRGARSNTTDDLAGNVGAIQGRLGGGQPNVAQPGAGGVQAQTALVTAREAAKQGVDAAYDAARATSAGIPADDLLNAVTQIKGRVAQSYNLRGLGRVQSVIDDLDDIAKPGADASVRVRSLFDWRQRANRAAAGANPEEGGAIRELIKGVDSTIDDMVGRALISGDDQAVEAFRKAISANREFASKFKAGDIIQKLTDRKPPAQGGRELVVPPDQASNAIFGSARLFGGGETARNIAKLRAELPPQEWNMVREEAWLRLVNAGRGPVDPQTGRQVFSGVNFAREFDKALQQYPAVMRVLFSPQELGLMQQFKRVAARATGTVKGGANFSNTTPALANLVTNLMNRIFVTEGAAARFAALPIVKTLYQGGMTVRAAGALSPKSAPTSLAPILAPQIAPPIQERMR